MTIRRMSAWSPRRGQSGFTLIEVLITMLVMAIGLLGFAMLQTWNVRFTKSAQQRTIASNLAYELLDMMRTQRQQASYYNGITYDSFAAASAGDCLHGADASPASNILRWKCEVKTALPSGQAKVELEPGGLVHVTVRWGDAFWETDQSRQQTSFTVDSRI